MYDIEDIEDIEDTNKLVDNGIENFTDNMIGNDKDVRSNRSVRNDEIQEKEKAIIDETSSKNPMLLSVMIWISNTVSIMYFSMIVTLVITKNSKWFYILLSVFIIVTCIQIIKIVMMRYDAKFLYRPGTCISDNNKADSFFYHNFILDRILEKIDINEYYKRGFPSVHMTSCVSILTMIYLFFPKYKKILLMVAPIYIILVGYSRMYLNCHTLLQVISSTIVGMLGGKLMYNVFK
jgi:membrane-associated phospholipid phosphatase